MIGEGRSSALAIVFGQFAFAAANFFTMLAGARTLSSTEFAWLAIAWIFYAVLLNAHRVLVAEQVLTLSEETRRHRAGILGASGAISAGSLVVISLVLLAVHNPGVPPLRFVAVGVLLLLYDAYRFVHLADRHVGTRLFVADVLCATGALVAFVLSVVQSGSAVYPVVASIGVLVSLVLLLEPAAPRLRLLVGFVRSMGSYAGWGSVQVIGVNLASQLLVVLSLPFISSAGFAALRAIQAVLSPLTTPAQAVQPLIFRAWLRRERSAYPWMRWYARWLSSGVVVVLLLTLSSYAWSSWLVRHTLSEKFVPYHQLVGPLLLIQGIIWIAIPGGVHLRVLRWARIMAVAQVAAVVCGAVLVLTLSKAGGSTGTAWALASQAFLSFVFTHAWLMRELARRPTRPDSQPVASS